MTLSKKKFAGEMNLENGKNLVGAPFKPSFGLGGAVDLASDLVAPALVFEGRVAHICLSLANVGNTDVGSRGFAFV
jgi:hypothetical protein